MTQLSDDEKARIFSITQRLPGTSDRVQVWYYEYRIDGRWGGAGNINLSDEGLIHYVRKFVTGLGESAALFMPGPEGPESGLKSVRVTARSNGHGLLLDITKVEMA